MSKYRHAPGPRLQRTAGLGYRPTQSELAVFSSTSSQARHAGWLAVHQSVLSIERSAGVHAEWISQLQHQLLQELVS